MGSWRFSHESQNEGDPRNQERQACRHSRVSKCGVERVRPQKTDYIHSRKAVLNRRGRSQRIPLSATKKAKKTGSIPVSSANALIADWRKHATACMNMARHHDKAKWKEHHARNPKKSNEHENDRYRWYRVAQTFRICANDLSRQKYKLKK